MSYEKFLELATNRRSIRKFSDKPVPREELEKVVQAAMHSPSGFNSQPWEMVVVDDDALRNQITETLLAGLGKTSRGFISAPVYIFLYGDERVRQFGPAAKVADDDWWDFTLSGSLSCSFMHMQLAATSLGLGSMWVSAFRDPKVEEPTRKLLNIPPHLKLYEMLAIGYPGMNAGKKKMRDISNVVHYNQASNYRSAEDLDSWF